jgi:molecular chaperone DnaK (HSP70)
MISNRPSVIGIDLGNVNTVVSMCRDRKIQTVLADTGKLLKYYFEVAQQ